MKEWAVHVSDYGWTLPVGYVAAPTPDEAMERAKPLYGGLCEENQYLFVVGPIGLRTAWDLILDPAV